MKLVIIANDAEVKKHINDLPDLTPRATRRAFYDIGRDMRDETRRLIMERPKHGRIYYRFGRKHIASAPGEAPANWTGKLRKSVGFSVRRDEVEYGYKIFYGKFLEEGTYKMKPRPGLRKAYENKIGSAINHFNMRFKEQLEGKL